MNNNRQLLSHTVHQIKKYHIRIIDDQVVAIIMIVVMHVKRVEI